MTCTVRQGPKVCGSGRESVYVVHVSGIWCHFGKNGVCACFRVQQKQAEGPEGRDRPSLLKHPAWPLSVYGGTCIELLRRVGLVSEQKSSYFFEAVPLKSDGSKDAFFECFQPHAAVLSGRDPANAPPCKDMDAVLAQENVKNGCAPSTSCAEL